MGGGGIDILYQPFPLEIGTLKKSYKNKLSLSVNQESGNPRILTLLQIHPGQKLIIQQITLTWTGTHDFKRQTLSKEAQQQMLQCVSMFTRINSF